MKKREKEKPLFKMIFIVDDELQIFNEECNDSRGMKNADHTKVRYHLSKCLIFTGCYFANFENSNEI